MWTRVLSVLQFGDFFPLSSDLIAAFGKDAPHQPFERSALLYDFWIADGVGEGRILVDHVMG
jgi:hypothetical protein